MDSVNEAASGAAAGVAGMKILGGTLGALGIGAAFATIVVMLTTMPKSPREWAVGLISTVIGSFGGGAYVIIKFELLRHVETELDVCAVIGIAFACGLPFWAIVRGVFKWIAKNEGKDVVEIAKDIKGAL